MICTHVNMTSICLSICISVGPQRDWFLQQLRHDVDLLQGLGVQDYSLLVGYHPLHEDEKIHDLGDLMMRVKK